MVLELLAKNVGKQSEKNIQNYHMLLRKIKIIIKIIKKKKKKNISELKKYNIDVLGNKYEVQREELRFNVSL